MPAWGRPINLLPPSDFELSFWGKFLKWAVTAGRYIIIVTEMVVIVAFLSRFKLDKEISDLNSEIEGKKNVLEAYWQKEQEFLAAQKKLDVVSGLLSLEIPVGKTINELAEAIPSEIKMNNIDFQPGIITMNATAISESGIGKTMARIAENTKWKTVELTSVSADPLKGIKFSVKLKL